MKRFVLLTLFTLVFPVISAETTHAQESEDTTQIAVTTTFLYDMVNILDEDINHYVVDLIIPAGEDPHVYSPKASDLRKMMEAEFVLYQGLDFEGRMMDLLETGIAVADDLNRDELVELEEEEEGMVVDPHFWFSITLYKEALNNVYDVLVQNNPEDEAQYEENLNAYIESLDTLDEYIQTELDKVPDEQRMLITPHDAFGYLGREYDIEVHAPQGFSTESEVSNREITDIAMLIVENNIPAIFVETTTNPDRMTRLQEIVESEGHEVEVVSGESKALLSDSLAPEGEVGDTFIDMYKRNIDIIVEHLN